MPETLRYKVRTIICKRCETAVTKRMPEKRKFCSKECYNTYPRFKQKNGTNQVCAQCYKEFLVTPDHEIKDIRFCSPACYNKYPHITKKLRNYSGDPRPKELLCKVCGSTKTKNNGRNYRTCKPCTDRGILARPDKSRIRKIGKTYGITDEQYAKMLENQDGKCAMCGALPDSSSSIRNKRRLAIDHDHITGQIRGLLCSVCNMHLGMYERIAEKAEKYLANYPQS